MVNRIAEQHAQFIRALRDAGQTATHKELSERTRLSVDEIDNISEELRQDGFVEQLRSDASDTAKKVLYLPSAGLEALKEYRVRRVEDESLQVDVPCTIQVKIPIRTVVEHRNASYQDSKDCIEDYNYAPLSEENVAEWVCKNMEWSDISGDASISNPTGIKESWKNIGTSSVQMSSDVSDATMGEGSQSNQKTNREIEGDDGGIEGDVEKSEKDAFYKSICIGDYVWVKIEDEIAGTPIGFRNGHKFTLDSGQCGHWAKVKVKSKGKLSTFLRGDVCEQQANRPDEIQPPMSKSDSPSDGGLEDVATSLGELTDGQEDRPNAEGDFEELDNKNELLNNK